jgi:hypothetical protein
MLRHPAFCSSAHSAELKALVRKSTDLLCSKWYASCIHNRPLRDWRIALRSLGELVCSNRFALRSIFNAAGESPICYDATVRLLRPMTLYLIGQPAPDVAQ